MMKSKSNFYARKYTKYVKTGVLKLEPYIRTTWYAH